MVLLPVLGQWYVTLFTVMFVLICLFMMLVILIQKPRGGGLSGAFGGAGGSASSVFGAKTGDVLTWFTVICFCLFIALSMLLTWTGNPAPSTQAPGAKSKQTDGAGQTGDGADKSGDTKGGDTKQE